jgi:CRISPR-associated endonuclease/helicase Cas3
VILPTIIGGYSDSGWDPSSTIAVRDLSPELSGTVSVSSEALEGWIGRSVTDDERTAIASLAPRDEPLDDESDVAAVLWASLVSDSDDLQPSRAAGLERVGPEGEPWFVWRVEDDLKLQAVDALDELSIAPTAELGDHLRHVGEMARRLAVAIGIDGPVLDAVAAAGAYHDLGKADPRFQRWLGAPEDTLLAKSGSGPASWARARVSSGWPAGARHELLSVQMLDEAVLRGLQLEEADLVRHLVVSHHGHGRPSAARSDEASVKVRASLGTVAGEFTLDPGRPDWQQPERYRHACERFGLWGVALLEALVRQADHIVSAVTEVQ